jgi:site-specific DNA-methyltransferase (adenine-specific)/modification methylase
MSRIDAYVNKAEGEEKVHPAQKPLVLMQWCLEQLKAKEGELVCDPYMGSGTTGVACVRMGLPFVGVEVVDKFFEISVRRIKRAIAKRGECFL